MKVTRLEDIAGQMNDLRTKAQDRGGYPGFPNLYEVMSLKPGYPIFIAGEPYSGKTEFLMELLVTSSELYGWKHFLYLGETGEERDIFGELCFKYQKKPYKTMIDTNRPNRYAMSEAERTAAEMWVNEHFYLMPPDSDFTLEKFYENVKNVESQYGVIFNTVSVDPVNDIEDLEYDIKYLNRSLKMVTRQSKANNRIDFLVNHIGTTHKVYDKDTGKRYKMPAMPDEWAGGKMWHRRAFQMLLIYRPPTFILDDNGMPYKENQTIVIVQKSKPKGVGKNGLVNLFWDWKKSRYYMDGMGDIKQYSSSEPGYMSKKEENEILEQYDTPKEKTVNKDQNPINIDDSDELPF